MSQKPAIVARVRDEDWAALHRMLLDRRTTIDAAVAWLKQRGYRISRVAVWNYRRAMSAQRIAPFVPAGPGMSDEDLRGKLAAAAATMTPAELGAVMMFAQFVLSCRRGSARLAGRSRGRANGTLARRMGGRECGRTN